MLEDQVANLLERYLGNYVRGLNKEALKISVWQGDVELTNMQLKPEALNALKLPVKVKAGFLGSVKLKVPWSRLGQDPVSVYLDRIFLLAEPETLVEGCSEDAIQEAKKSRVREMEMKLLERMHQLKSEMNKSWLGSLISTVIGNLKLSISDIHIRYEDLESNPGHPFATGLTLEKLLAVTVDDSGKETFVSGGALDRIQKSVELDRLALYLDSDILPWHINKPWEDLLPSEWVQAFRFGTKDGRPADHPIEEHTYVLQPVTGNAKYLKLQQNGSSDSGEPLQKGAVSLDDVTLCLSKDGYRDILKLADNFTAFNLRLKYAHYRPPVSLKSDPRSWWNYAYKAVSDQMKKASGKLSWEQVLRYTRLRKKYISLYASLLKSDVNRPVVDDNKEIEELDRGLDIELILQWRMLAHKFVEQSMESENYLKKQKAKQSWWSFGWSSQSLKDDSESFRFSEEDWEQLNKIIGYKEDDDGQSLMINEKPDILQTSLEIHMKHNASKLLDGAHACLAELSCEGLDCSIKLYPETKVFDVKLGSYQLISPNGLLAESATTSDSLVGVFRYKPFDAKVDWSMVAKASPCYVTYLKDSLDEVIKFFESNTAVSQTIALETATAVQMTIDGVKRSAQQQVNRALKDHARFLLDLDIAAPKITIPTEFRPDNKHSTKLLLDLGNLIIRSQDDYACTSSEELDLYLQFDLVLSDVSAFLVDGDYHWSQTSLKKSAASTNIDGVSFLPVIDKCGVILKLQQIRLENPSYPSTRLLVQLPSLGFHFSPARYHRLMQVIKIFQEEDNDSPDLLRPWNHADFEGWLSVLSRKGVGNREAVWQWRYFCLVGPFLYVLESPGSKSYKQYISLRGKQAYPVPAELVGDVESVLAVCDAARSNNKAVVEDVNALILRCENDDLRKAWQSRLQGAIYHASASAPITSLSATSSDSETEPNDKHDTTDLARLESVFITGVLDELKISFTYNHQHEWSFIKVLLAEEYPLFEFRAIRGQVELSIKGNDMFIGTVLKSLEIEDLICCNTVSQPCFLARSFIRSADAHSLLDDAGNQSFESKDLSQIEGDDKFYEAPENLVDSVECTTPTPRKAYELVGLQKFLSSEKTSFKTRSFSRVTGLLPDDNLLPRREDVELSDTLDSFVKAQIVIYDQNSPLYNNIDMKVTVTLATLSFFCRRPTILAIMEFANAVTIEDEICGSFSDNSSAVGVKHDISSEDPAENPQSTNIEEPVVKGLLGKGKSRIIFNLTLNMDHAQILLMNENETKFATLSQENLLTDIKVFPSSFSINAALGNLRISDDSLPSNHQYFRICDMRDPGGTSFVELVFTSFSFDDEDYEGYEYSLFGQLSEVRIVYLNRFVQEVISYFMGLIPKDSKDVVKLKDQVTNSEKWFTTSEIEGSPALRLDLSLRKPIILMPRRTDSLDYLKLDVVHITVRNTFQWFCGSKSDLNAVHFEIMTILVEDINLNVGTKSDLNESIIKDVKGVSFVIWRSLRDLMHQVPSIEAAIKIEELKVELSNREYQIVTECALSNISETPRIVPPLSSDFMTPSVDVVEPVIPQNMVVVEPRTPNGETWTVMKVSVVINLIELGLYVGEEWRSPLAIVQASGAWLLYKSNTLGEGFLSASLKGFTVIDDRVGTEEEFRLAIGMPKNPLASISDTNSQLISDANVTKENNIKPFPTMLLLDAKFGQFSTSVSVSLQRPQLLVALDFLLALVEFFVPTVGSMLTNEEDKKSLQMVDAIILDKSTYTQPSAQFSLSPVKPLIADDEKFDRFIYDGNGGVLHLKDREGVDLSAPSNEAMIYVGNGKKLQFKNVLIRNGQYLDSSISLGTNSGYSASKDDLVYLEGGDEGPQVDTSGENANDMAPQNAIVDRSAEFIIEFQAIGPELTFYNASKDMGDSSVLSNKLLLGQLDAFGRDYFFKLFIDLFILKFSIYPMFLFDAIFQDDFMSKILLYASKHFLKWSDVKIEFVVSFNVRMLVLKGDTVEMTANALGLTMESNGIRILEPFDTSIKYSNASGKTNIHLSVSDIFMNFSFSILRLFLAVEEDILAFLRTTSKEMTVDCSQFDRVGTIRNPNNDQIYAFWRARAPVGFAVLGDYLTPLDKPPRKGVLAINTNYVRVKRPVSFKRIWPPLDSGGISAEGEVKSNTLSNGVLGEGESSCSVWFPEAPEGYVALGCVVSTGKVRPSPSSTFCILASFVSPCSLRDCITISDSNLYPSSLAFWRVDNSLGTFLPAERTTLRLLARAYELRHVIIRSPEVYPKASRSSDIQTYPSGRVNNRQSDSSTVVNSGRRFEAVVSFRLVWWNRGSSSMKQLSLWRPVVPQGMVYFGDIAVQAYEPPNTCIVLHDSGDEELFKAPLGFQLVGQIKKQRGMENISFWLPQAPRGYVSLGCIACKGPPKQQDFCALRCMRSDMVTGDQFLEESVWDTSDTKFGTEPFSIWVVANELGTFFVRGGSRKPPRRFALKLADPYLHSGSDDTVIDAEIRTFSAALFDDYSGLMVPLFNISLSGIAFSLHGRTDYSNSTVSFSLAARSYNDKYESWEPIVEPLDGFLRYQYDPNAPGAASQLRFTSTKDLNLNISVSNANMIIQAYASWNNLIDIHQHYKRPEAFSPTSATRSIVDVHHKRSYYIIPQNKLGQDIFIRATEMRGFSDIIRMPSGDTKPIKVPVSKNMLDSHLRGKLCKKTRMMVTIIIADATFPRVEGWTSRHYTVAVRLSPDHSLPSESLLHQQSARTCGRISSYLSSDIELVDWSEMFFFKVDSPDSYTVELIVADVGKGDAVGFFSAPLNQIAMYIPDDSHQYDYINSLMWMDLSLVASMNTTQADRSGKKSSGKLRCAVILSPKSDVDERNELFIGGRKSGFIQISPSMEGPWTTVRLNYAAPAACWRLGNDVVASEVSVKDGNRYVNIRSLVSVHNNTDFILDLFLVSKASSEMMERPTDINMPESVQLDGNGIQTDEILETKTYDPNIGWVDCNVQLIQDQTYGVGLQQATSGVELPSGWEWIDDWHLDTSSTNTAGGWVCAPDVESLKWPESDDSVISLHSARQRKWTRNRKQISLDAKKEIFVGHLKPGDTVPLPLSALTQSGPFVFQLRPSNFDGSDKYSWSSVVGKPGQLEVSGKPKGTSEIYVSALTESEELLCCTQLSETSSDATSHKLWFCLGIQATEISKDFCSYPILDWSLVVKSPLSITNYLPITAEYSILEMRASGHFIAGSRGIFLPGRTVITVRPYMTFTNRLGQDMRHDATRTFLRVEIRGYEEGSRFIVVFRLGSTKGPVRIENRTIDKTICICQSGFGEYAWISLEALSSTIFSWEDPYGQKVIDGKIDGDCNNRIWKVDLERAGQFSAGEGEFGIQFHVFEIGNIKVVRFADDWTWNLTSHEDTWSLTAAGKPQIDVTPVEIIIELGVVGVSVVDHMPKELFYLYLDRVFISYSTGYDGGITSRFKLILGHLQIDNQLPLTSMPVLLAPEQMSDIHHPAFKMTIAMRNVNTDGTQVYPYVYIRVTDKCWRLNIHEPIIWAIVDFYNNLQLDHIPQSSSVTQVDPEIRVEGMDVSEVRLKVSLVTATAQRPHGVLGVWSPILSAVGNSFKIQVHLRRLMRKDRFMRRSSILPAIGNRIWRDLIHNPLHLLFSVNVLGMTSSTLASLSKGFAELSTDGQFLQLRSKQVSSRRITGVGDGIIQGTEALAQGVAFGVSGVLTKPVESARRNGLLGLAHGIGHAFLGFIVQPVSGALDFVSLTVDGIGASCSKCLEVLNNKSTFQRIRNPRAIHADGILTEYSEKEATGQMVLYLAEASRHFGCTEIFKEPSKFASSDYYEEHFIVPCQKIVLVTNKRVMLLQCSSLDKMDKKPCKIMWDVPWEELMALELANAGSQLPSHLLLHLKNFRRSETFVRVINCTVEEVEGIEPQAVKICSVVRKMWRAHQSDINSIMPKILHMHVPSSQRYVHFSWSETNRKAPQAPNKSIIKSRELSSSSSASDGTKFVKHSINFLKIWSSERELKGRCALCRKQVADDGGVCSIWRPICPDGYVSIGDIARVGSHPPNVAAVYQNVDKLFALPVGYDLVWRNCRDDYTNSVSIWYPRAPEGFTSPGCVAVAGFAEPEADLVHCVAETLAEETTFEEQKVWSAPESYPWGCHVYQVHSDALHFVALRETKEESDWKPTRVHDDLPLLQSSEAQ
ncbi:hypothetical protein CRYUN_Cryun12cG0020000 [Craigia yunnanensis]